MQKLGANVKGPWQRLGGEQKCQRFFRIGKAKKVIRKMKSRKKKKNAGTRRVHRSIPSNFHGPGEFLRNKESHIKTKAGGNRL